MREKKAAVLTFWRPGAARFDRSLFEFEEDEMIRFGMPAFDR
jgi:hypothetical protein